MCADQHDCQASVGSCVLRCKPARMRVAVSASHKVVTFACVGVVCLQECLLDRVVGKWYVRGVSSYTGVHLCFLVRMVRKVVHRSRLEATQRGHPLQCATCCSLMETVPRGRPARCAKCRRLRLWNRPKLCRVLCPAATMWCDRSGPPFNVCWYRGKPFFAITACSKAVRQEHGGSINDSDLATEAGARRTRVKSLSLPAMIRHSRAGCGSPAAGLYAFLPGNLPWTSSWACTQWCTQVILHNLDPGAQTSAFPSAHWRRCCRLELGLRTRRRSVTITD